LRRRNDNRCAGIFSNRLVPDNEFEIAFLEDKFRELVLAHHPDKFLYLVEVHTGKCFSNEKRNGLGIEGLVRSKIVFFNKMGEKRCCCKWQTASFSPILNMLAKNYFFTRSM
jgi:hypothetical protein